jgi:nucleotidyltransferase/DNA polymerase involved in DNA repair
VAIDASYAAKAFGINTGTLMREARQAARREPPVMSRRLQRLERMDLQRFANPASEHGADPRDRLEQSQPVLSQVPIHPEAAAKAATFRPRARIFWRRL